MIQFTKPIYLALLIPLAYYVWRVAGRSLTDLSPIRSKVALGLRLVILTLLVLALAGARTVRNAPEQCAIFALDVSDSIPQAKRDAALRYVNESLKTMKSNHKAGMIVFGGDSSVELAPSSFKKVGKVYSVPNTTNTDISQALGLALASFPEKAAKKIVLLSDGNETLGKALEQAALAGSDNVSIDVVPLSNDLPHEVLLDKMVCPGSVKVGEPFDLRVVGVAREPVLARIRVLRNGAPTATRTVELPKGKSVLTFQQSIPKAGSYEFKAILEAERDTKPENNLALAYTMVRGKPKALYIEGEPGQGKYLANALRKSDIDVDERDKAGIPNTLAQLRAYDMLILSDIPAWNMAPDQMQMIKSGVKDLGIGFTMIGGENSFGAGGYFQTPIEETLPVNMSVRKTKVMPSLSVVVVMDKSGSMGMVEDGREKIQLANDAAAAVVSLLQPIDYISVVVCHSSPVTAVPLQLANNKGPIYGEISTIRAEGGGIAVAPSMKMAYDIIHKAKTRQKHIILLADGADCDEQQGVVPLAFQMAKERITVTTVAIGDGPHVPFLKDVALAGKGDFYLTLRARDLKAIFTKDVMKVSKSLVIEEPFIPAMDASAPELGGIDPGSVPPLLGYITSSPKSTASVSMVSHKKDPVLATWQFGLGRSAAFTSDCKARWSARWLTWPSYNKFWAQVLRSTMRKSGPVDFQTTTDISSGRGQVAIDAVDDKGQFINFLKFGGSVVGPDMKPHALAIDQTGPGRYEASFDGQQVGTYVVNVVRKGGKENSSETDVISVPYPPEYKDVTPNTALLQRLASETSGVYNPPASEIFSKRFRTSKVYTDLWFLLAMLAAILLPIDVAVRRVVITPQQAMEIYHRAIEAMGVRRTKRLSREPETVQTVGTLLRGKKRRSGDVEPVADEQPAIQTEAPKEETAVTWNIPPPEPRSAKEKDEPEPAKEAEGEESLSSRLLQAKRRNRGDS